MGGGGIWTLPEWGGEFELEVLSISGLIHMFIFWCGGVKGKEFTFPIFMT